MESRAQTNAQLFLQMREQGCSAADFRLVRDAYLLAMQLYSGLYTGSGKTTVAHEVGTASLAIRHGGSVELAAAGLLHGAYIVGDWGQWRTRPTAAQRTTVRRVLGARAETWVHELSLLPWGPSRIAALAERTAPFDEVEHHVVLLKLLEALDHLLDCGAILFFRRAEPRKADLRDNREPMCRLAERLGKPALAGALREAIDLNLSADLPDELLGLEFPAATSPLLVPASCHRRPALRLYRALSSTATRLSRRLQSPPAAS